MPTDDTDPLIAELTRAETQVWEALVAGDPVADGAALSADFLGVYPDGFAGRSDHMEALSLGPTVSRYALSDHRVIQFSPDFAMLSYRAEYLSPGRSVPDVMYVSSVWRRDGAGWINVFSQDTPASP